MVRVSLQLDPLTSTAAFDELCDVVLREYPDQRWIIALGEWDVDGRVCVVFAPGAEEVETAFAQWCADMGLGAPRAGAREADPEELAELRSDQGLDQDDDDDE